MNILQSRSEQLADHLRGCIQRRDLHEPLLGNRAWSRQLGVGRHTLSAALQILAREGLVEVEARGVRLKPAGWRRIGQAPPPQVRILFHGRNCPEGRRGISWIHGLAERLHRDGVELTTESCDQRRLEAHARAPGSGRELLVLLSLPARYQKLFAAGEKPAVLVGDPAQGIDMAYVSVDLKGLARHATLSLLRKGLTRVALLVDDSGVPGIQQVAEVFHQTCADWSRARVEERVIPLPLERDAMVAAAARFARTIKERYGIILWEEIPAGLVMTALMAKGIAVPAQAEIVSVLATSESRKVYPPPVCYPFPTDNIAKTLAAVVERYFETGVVPQVRKRIATSRVAASESPAMSLHGAKKEPSPEACGQRARHVQHGERGTSIDPRAEARAARNSAEDS